MKYGAILFSCLFFNSQFSLGQNLLNGDFENNTAITDLLNLSNVAFNISIENTTAFGTLGNCDIITSAIWGGSGAQNGDWYIALTGGGSDRVSMEFDVPLVTDQTYTFSFWDRKEVSFGAFTIEIGISNSASDMGEIVYTTPLAPANNLWTERVFTFVAPINGLFLTMQQTDGSASSSWVHVDNFQVVCDVDVELGEYTTLCEGETVVLDATTEDATYEWEDGSTESTHTITETGLYSVTVTVEGCAVYDVIAVTFIDYPELTMEEELTSCIDVPVDVSVETNVLLPEYLWSDGSTESNITAESPGFYSVQVTNGGLCASSDSTLVTFVDYPIIDLGEDQLLCAGDPFILQTQGAGFQYTWQDGSDGSSYSVVEPGIYSVEVSNGYCTSSDAVEIEFEFCNSILEIPNIFTPNSDLWNSEFRPIERINVESWEVKIFNRWGNLVFETTDLDTYWKGQDLNGGKSSSGTYYYWIEFVDKAGNTNSTSGYVTLIGE